MVRNDIVYLFFLFFSLFFSVECYGTIAVLPGLARYIINFSIVPDIVDVA